MKIKSLLKELSSENKGNRLHLSNMKALALDKARNRFKSTANVFGRFDKQGNWEPTVFAGYFKHGEKTVQFTDSLSAVEFKELNKVLPLLKECKTEADYFAANVADDMRLNKCLNPAARRIEEEMQVAQAKAEWQILKVLIPHVAQLQAAIAQTEENKTAKAKAVVKKTVRQKAEAVTA
jgi:hypothetical protein